MNIPNTGVLLWLPCRCGVHSEACGPVPCLRLPALVWVCQNQVQSWDGERISQLPTSQSIAMYLKDSLIPRPRPAFCRLQCKKAVEVWGEPGNEATSRRLCKQDCIVEQESLAWRMQSCDIVKQLIMPIWHYIIGTNHGYYSRLF